MSDIKHLRAIFEKAPLGIFITSREGELMDVNERFALFMGFASGKQMKDSVKKRVQDCCLDELTWDNIVAQLNRPTEVAVQEVKFLRGDQQVVYGRVSVTKYANNTLVGMVEDISEIKELEHQLQASNNRFTNILDSLPFELWVFDKNGVVFNQSGFSRRRWGNYTGRNIREFPLKIFDESEWGNFYINVLQGQSFDHETEVEVMGQSVCVRRFLSPLMDGNMPVGIISISFDQTEKVRIRERAQEIHEFLETVINSIPVMLFWKNADLQFIGANQAFLDDLELESEADLHGKTDYDFLNRNDADFLHNLYQEVIQTQTARLNFKKWLTANGGKEQFVMGSIMPLQVEREGKMLGILGCFQNITQLKEMEDELVLHRNRLEQLVDARTQVIRQLNKKLLASNEELVQQKQELEAALEHLKATQNQLIHSEKMASLGIMTAGIAHEINNPLNFISSGIYGVETVVGELEQTMQSLMLEGVMGDTQGVHKLPELLKDMKDLIDAINNGVERTTNIVRGLRIFSRMDTEEKSVADIHELIGVALVILKNSYKNNIEVRQSYGDIPNIRCFPGKLSQVFINLIMNAIQAIEGAGVIELTTRYLPDVDSVEIIVSDDGGGISEEIRHRIFDPFFTTKGINKGTGLGLSIVHTIVSEHDGHISCDSTPGLGTKFRIVLPTV